MIRCAAPMLLLACSACGGGTMVVDNATSATTPVATAPTPVSQSVVAAPVASPTPEATPTDNTALAPLNEAELQAYPEARGMPADVQRYMVRRADCEHWAGEELYDAARKAEIEANVAEACTGLDAETAALRRRHANDSAASAWLAGVDPIGM